MTYNRDYQQFYKTKERVKDKELGQRYRSDEALQGETYTEFKKRITREELQSIQLAARKVYPAWVQMPDETDDAFKKRLYSVHLGVSEKIPAWKKAPDETKDQFKKRFTSKEL